MNTVVSGCTIKFISLSFSSNSPRLCCTSTLFIGSSGAEAKMSPRLNPIASPFCRLSLARLSYSSSSAPSRYLCLISFHWRCVFVSLWVSWVRTVSSGGREGGCSYSSVHVVPDSCACNIPGPGIYSSASSVPAHHVVGSGSGLFGGAYIWKPKAPAKTAPSIA